MPVEQHGCISTLAVVLGFGFSSYFFFLSKQRNGALGKLVVPVDLMFAQLSSADLASVCALTVFKCLKQEKCKIPSLPLSAVRDFLVQTAPDLSISLHVFWIIQPLVYSVVLKGNQVWWRGEPVGGYHRSDGAC